MYQESKTHGMQLSHAYNLLVLPLLCIETLGNVCADWVLDACQSIHSAQDDGDKDEEGDK